MPSVACAAGAPTAPGSNDSATASTVATRSARRLARPRLGDECISHPPLRADRSGSPRAALAIKRPEPAPAPDSQTARRRLRADCLQALALAAVTQAERDPEHEAEQQPDAVALGQQRQPGLDGGVALRPDDDLLVPGEATAQARVL